MTAKQNTFYPAVDANPDFPAIERKVLENWQQNQTFETSVENRPSQVSGKNNEYIFYDGPPFANGLPHYGHLLTGYVKDLFARYHTMLGSRVERRFGWDCHGLPAEMGAEKELGVSGRANIEKYGIQKFNDYCRTSVMKYTGEWEEYVTRQARWVDFGNDYKTMDVNYMESVMWAFSELYKKGLVYESHRVMPYSWAMETPVSNFETRMDNSYREREDKAITVAFRLKDVPKRLQTEIVELKEAKGSQGSILNPDFTPENLFVLAWTTTPWTLPSNLALAAKSGMSYRAFHENGNLFLAAADWVRSNKNKESEFLHYWPKGANSPISDDGTPYTHHIELDGSDLIGLAYDPLFPYFALYNKPDAIVTTDRLYLRPFREEDFADYRRLQSDPKVAATTSDGVLPDELIRKEFDRFLADQAKKGFSQWAVFRKEDDVFIGRAGFDNRDYDQFNTTGKSCVELRYAYLSDFWGKGYASEAAAAVLSWGKRQKLAELVVAGCNPTYDSAVNLLRKLGLTSYECVPYKNQQVLYHDLPFDEWQIKPDISNRFHILDGSDFIEEGSGTGIVHMAPGFGEDDQRVCAANGIELVVPVDERGCYTDAIFEHDGLALAGLNVIAETTLTETDKAQHIYEKDVNKYGLANMRITRWLKAHGRLIKDEPYSHNYPHCWRTDTPLIYRALPSWYVEVSKFAPRMVELNEQINWVPDHIKHGRFGKWLEGARDWSISRNRYWGSPIPVWKNDKDDEVKVFGSIKELEAFFNVEVKDLHRPFIDELVKEENGKTWRRVTDVFDCWFESGSMPYAQVHYPFENKDWFETHFPADFIVEYEAQTRGWFYTLMVLSTALFDKPPFKNCICHGVVMSNEKDENGHYHKLSKRLKNYPDPMQVFGEYGADALRWFMMYSPVMRGSEMYIDKEGKFIRDSVRLYLKPIWNAYNFFTLYANADGVKAELDFVSQNGMDRYILSKLAHAVRQVQQSLDAYDTPGACQAVTAFFEDLNNWYIRRNKERFWKAEHDADKQAAYNTLYSVLHVMSRAISPLLPLISDEIYKGLTGGDSVHLADFPRLDFAEDKTLTASMDFVREVCNAALAVRNKSNIRVRQPLSKLTIVADAAKIAASKEAFFDIIKDEINVKEVSLDANAADLKQFAELKTQVNLPVVGKKLGPAVKAVMAAARNGEWVQNGDKLELAGVTLEQGEYSIMLEPKPEYKDSAQALSSNDALVILDLTITPELEAEGIARDVVRMIQQSRKDADLDVSAHIDLTLDLPPHHADAVRTHADYIREQTLADSLHIGTANHAVHSFEHMLDEQKVTIALSLSKVAA